MMSPFGAEAVIVTSRCRAGGEMGKFDRHPAVLDVPGRTDRRAERQRGADHRGLQQNAVTIQGLFAGDVGRGAPLLKFGFPGEPACHIVLVRVKNGAVTTEMVKVNE